MRRHHGVSAEDEDLDLKQGGGGIVDIEFMVQYAVLAWAAMDRSLADWSDNVRILDTLGTLDILATLDTSERVFAKQCRDLKDAYLTLRSATHQLALQQQTAKVPAENFATQSQRVRRAWATLFTGISAGAAS
jgi:glutamate-ammonia-ligase adenylyltransferase